jgi:hypothetical protein
MRLKVGSISQVLDRSKIMSGAFCDFSWEKVLKAKSGS